MYIILEIDNVISDDSWRADKIKNEKLMPSGKFHEYAMRVRRSRKRMVV
jgi:hypothetical protein